MDRAGSARHLAPATLVCRRRQRRAGVALLALTLAAGAAEGCRRPAPLQFRVTIAEARRSTPADGRLLVLLSRDTTREPRLSIDREFQVTKVSSTTTQVFGMNVDGWAPGRGLVFDRSALGFPLERLDEVPPGEYSVQAVLNLYETLHRKDGHTIKVPMDKWDGQRWSTKPGNLYSEPRRMWIDPQRGGTIALALD